MAASRLALTALAILTIITGWCSAAPQQTGGAQGGAQVPPAVPFSTAPPAGVGGIRRFSQYSRGRGYRDWRTRGDPTLINSLWRSRQPLGIRKQLGWCSAAPQQTGGAQGGAQVPPAVPFSTAPPAGVGGIRRFSQYSRGRGYRDWRTRGDPTLINSLWRSRQPLGIRKQLGNAEVYIVLALLIGFVTVVVGCWLSDNCWSPEPEDALAS